MKLSKKSRNNDKVRSGLLLTIEDELKEKAGEPRETKINSKNTKDLLMKNLDIVVKLEKEVFIPSSKKVTKFKNPLKNRSTINFEKKNSIELSEKRMEYQKDSSYYLKSLAQQLHTGLKHNVSNNRCSFLTDKASLEDSKFAKKEIEFIIFPELADEDPNMKPVNFEQIREIMPLHQW